MKSNTRGICDMSLKSSSPFFFKVVVVNGTKLGNIQHYSLREYVNDKTAIFTLKYLNNGVVESKINILTL